MSGINHHIKTVKDILSNTYKVPYYQREYLWKRKQFEDLLNDLQEEFLESHNESNGRESVAHYKDYFLGTVLTTVDHETSRKIIIDGQQRLTSLTILFIYLHRKRIEKPELKISDYIGLIKKESYGQDVLNFQVDNSRGELINKLINIELDDIEIDNYASRDDNPLDEGTENFYSRYKDINEILTDKVKDNYLAFFCDWLAEKVTVSELVVPTEHDAHKVFVTMNDRGLHLSPTDMLKGFLLSRITDSKYHKDAHKLWQEKIKELKEYDKEEDSNFLRTWLRAKYAKESRGSKKSEPKKDFENIGDSYHRWLHENREIVKLNNDDDFKDFVLNKFKKNTEVYAKILKYSDKLHEEFEHIYYNASKVLTLQNMVIIASVSDKDNEKEVDRKIKLTSRYLDLYTTVRVLNNKKNTYDNLKEPLFSLLKKIRDKSINQIKSIFSNHYNNLGLTIDNALDSFTYENVPAKNILHILARIGDYLENGIQQINKVGFEDYIDRKRNNKTFDIEHILPADYNLFITNNPEDNDFDSEAEFKQYRNMLGGLVLLQRSRNRSLKDQIFTDKVNAYQTDNILSQTLATGIYQNNPNLDRFIKDTNIKLKPYNVFNKKSIIERQELYKSIMNKIWSIDDITS